MRIIAFFTLFLPTLASAQTFGGVGTRADGMGGAFVAVADDASAVYWNPAGVATGATFDFQVSRGLTPVPVPGSDPNATVFVGATLPVLGLSYYRTHTVQASADRQNDGPGKVPIRTLTTGNYGATFVQSVAGGVVIGTTARLVRGGYDSSDSRTTVDLDAGAMVSLGNVRFGLTGRNLRQPEFDHESGRIAVERQVRAGVALAPRSLPAGVHGPFTVAFDGDLTRTAGPDGDLRMAALGGEYWIAQGRVGARAGITWNTVDDPERAFSWGLTVKLPRSIFVEGRLTNLANDQSNAWTVGARVTF